MENLNQNDLLGIISQDEMVSQTVVDDNIKSFNKELQEFSETGKLIKIDTNYNVELKANKINGELSLFLNGTEELQFQK